MLYLLSVTIGLSVAYLFLYFLFPLFFNSKLPQLTNRSFLSIFYIGALSFISYFISFQVSDPWLSNRLLHTLGGGLLSFVTCFLAIKDSKLSIGKFQFFLLSFLIVIALGVGNEIIEFFLQNYFHFTFAQTVNDTWLDLINNIVGALIGAILLTPFIKSTEVQTT
jgi:hypothetical protein